MIATNKSKLYLLTYSGILWCLAFGYLFLVTSVGRLGDKLKYAELLFPVLLVFLALNARFVTKVFTPRFQLAYAGFFAFVIVMNSLYFSVGRLPVIHAIALPGRFLEISLTMIIMGVVTYKYPKASILGFGFLFGFLIVFAIANLVFVFSKGYYGRIVLPGEIGPNQVGIVFSLAFLFFLSVVLHFKELRNGYGLSGAYWWLSLIGAMAAFVIVLMNGQRTSAIAMIGATLLYVFWRLLKMQVISRKVIVSAIFVIGLVGISVYLNIGDFGLVGEDVGYLINRLQAGGPALEGRVERWAFFFGLVEWDLFNALLGNGLGSHGFYHRGDLTLRFDSLYLRLFFELGLIGTILFSVALMFLWTKTLRRNPFAYGLFFLLIAFMIISSFAFESLFVYVAGTIFSAGLGFCTGLSAYNSNEHKEAQTCEKIGQC